MAAEGHDIPDIPDIPDPDAELLDPEAGGDIGGVVGPDQVNLTELLKEMVSLGASDLHLAVGTYPAVRLNGALHRLEHHAELRPQPLQQALYDICTETQQHELDEELELDMSYSVAGLARFRVNIHWQRGAIGAVMRAIPMGIAPLEKLGVPDKVRDFAYLPRGLVLVTGPTGSGKSTTLASIVDLINKERPVNIITVEDPIEFLHNHQRANVSQREVGADTKSFANALKRALRQDPDVILVGEMRDLETISVALTAAETGHVVFGTLHTQDAPQTMDRIIDVFPPDQQEQVRVQLAGSIEGVLSQQLLPRSDRAGRTVACELLTSNDAVRNLIREGKTAQLRSTMQAGADRGMCTKEMWLARLVKAGRIDIATAYEASSYPEEIEEYLR